VKGGKRPGAGRPRDSVKPWNRISTAERFYMRLWGITKRGDRRPPFSLASVYRTECELYKEDHPDDPHIRNKKRFDKYRETLKKLRLRGRNEAEALAEEDGVRVRRR
jgi:hypothetical protein